MKMKFFKYPKISAGQIWLFVGLMVLTLAVTLSGGATAAEGVMEASLVGTLMQPLRSEYTPTFDKNELRESRYGALRFFQEEASARPIFDPETIANIQRSFGNSVVVPVLDSQVVTVTTPYTRTCSLVDSENDSALVSLTFATYGWGFTMTPATHYNNDISYARDFERKMKKYLIQFSDLLDSAAIAQLEADKNAYFPAAILSYYAVVADALQVPQTEKNDFYNQVESIMATMDYYDTAHIVSSTKHMPVIRRDQAQGGGNNTNQEFQFNGTGSEPTGQMIRPFNYWPTNRVPNGAGVESAAYIVGAGSVYIGNRNDADAVQGNNVGSHKIWSEEQMPIANMNMASYYQQDCGDRSAIAGAATAGNTRSFVEGFEFSTDIVLASVYNSTPASQYQPIVKAEILN